MTKKIGQAVEKVLTVVAKVGVLFCLGWLFTAGAYGLVCLCFGWAFSWMAALGVWIAVLAHTLWLAYTLGSGGVIVFTRSN